MSRCGISGFYRRARTCRLLTYVFFGTVQIRKNSNYITRQSFTNSSFANPSKGGVDEVARLTQECPRTTIGTQKSGIVFRRVFGPLRRLPCVQFLSKPTGFVIVSLSREVDHLNLPRSSVKYDKQKPVQKKLEPLDFWCVLEKQRVTKKKMDAVGIEPTTFHKLIR